MVGDQSDHRERANLRVGVTDIRTPPVLMGAYISPGYCKKKTKTKKQTTHSVLKATQMQSPPVLEVKLQIMLRIKDVGLCMG